MCTLEKVLVCLESLEGSSADSARLGETVAAGVDGAQTTMWGSPCCGEEGFCDRALPTLGRLLPPPVAGVDITAMVALQGAGAGAQSSREPKGVPTQCNLFGVKCLRCGKVEHGERLCCNCRGRCTPRVRDTVAVRVAPAANGLDGLMCHQIGKLVELFDGKDTHKTS